MTRMIGLVVVVFGAFGLAAGWLAFSPLQKPSIGEPDRAVSPAEAARAEPPTTVGPVRHEFFLSQEDIANDRETPAVAADDLGHVLLAWAAQSGESERTLYLARSTDGGKSFLAPVPWRKVPIYRYSSAAKGQREAMSYSTHVLPRLVSTRGEIVLGWVEAIDGGPAVAYFIARSTDGGQSFGEPAKIHGGDASRPGFTTLSVAPDGSLLAAWLDGRNRGQQPFFAAKPADSEGFEPERLVYAGPDGKGICPCCDVAAIRVPDGSDLVAFRNSDGGHRDIYLASARAGGPFGKPAPLSLDNWTFEGCPHDGPSLALAGNRLYATWMSAFSGRNRVYVAGSAASDLSFTPHELHPGAKGAQAHPKLVVDGRGKLYAVWDESLDDAGPAPTSTHHAGGHGAPLTGTGRAVMIAAATDGNLQFSTPTAVAPRAGAFQLNPTVVAGNDGAILIAWNELDPSGKRVVFVRRELSWEGRR
jgi:hypothetical protein